MYYHVRLDKILHNGRTDMDAQVEWDFQSLAEALAMIERKFGKDAACWRIQDLTERTLGLMQQEVTLRTALNSTYQYVVMTFKDGAPELERYDHYEFFVVTRDEAEHPMSSLLMKEVASIKVNSESPDVFIDIQKEPIAAIQYRSCVSIFDYADGSFHGVAVILKDGKHIVVFAGDNDNKGHVNLCGQGIARGLVRRVLPSVSEDALRGFRVLLTTGERLYLTISKLIVMQVESNANACNND